MSAEHSPDPHDSLRLLEQLREIMISGGADPNHDDQPFQWIDAAIEKLQTASKS